MVRLFPHEVVDVEPVLALLTKQDPENHAVCQYTPERIVV